MMSTLEKHGWLPKASAWTRRRWSHKYRPGLRESPPLSTPSRFREGLEARQFALHCRCVGLQVLPIPRQSQTQTWKPTTSTEPRNMDGGGSISRPPKNPQANQSRPPLHMTSTRIATPNLSSSQNYHGMATYHCCFLVRAFLKWVLRSRMVWRLLGQNKKWGRIVFIPDISTQRKHQVLTKTQENDGFPGRDDKQSSNFDKKSYVIAKYTTAATAAIGTQSHQSPIPWHSFLDPSPRACEGAIIKEVVVKRNVAALWYSSTRFSFKCNLFVEYFRVVNSFIHDFLNRKSNRYTGVLSTTCFLTGKSWNFRWLAREKWTWMN